MLIFRCGEIYSLACGHVFCADDLWNWFHRTGGDSDDDDVDDLSETDSLDSQYIPPVRRQARAYAQAQAAVARLPREQRIRRLDPDVENDYATDDTLSEEDEDEDDLYDRQQLVRARERIAAERAAAAAAAAPATINNAPREAQNNSNTAAVPVAGDTESAVAAGPAAQAGRRVPALAQPRKRNLVCPQCRTHVALPPFPVFMVRDLVDVVGQHVRRGRAPSHDNNADDASPMEDITWGGLFPRAAS